MVRGALAAAVTPLRDGGERLDEDAVTPYVRFLAAGGMDGIFALGTTGEGILLRPDERRRATETFLEAAEGRLPVVVHCGAQTTTETAALCEHAAQLGAVGVAVVAPPYYEFDERGLAAHFAAAARACAPTRFYLYEFAARSGYAIPLSVVERLREEAPNLAGMKVSDAPFEAVRPYLVEGLDVFIGQEGLLPAGMAAGAAGTVSGLAAVFPEPVAALVHGGDEEALERVRALREGLQRAPFISAAKHALGRRGVPVRGDVRAPLRTLTVEERSAVDRTVAEWLESPPPARSPAGAASHSDGG
ncbi:MAG: dihydrodipicolinate synthase family protein [Actinomycetota bacterium]|nr:dihydrodipicolinate synthase family protein [Actinomycetota bacterium]